MLRRIGNSPALRRIANSPASRKISAAFLVPGVLSLIFSIYSQSQILAFIGLGLTFWGALLILITPERYVETILLDSAALPSYLTIDRIIKDLEYKGKAYYTPPYPKDVYLPEHLKGLKETVIFVSAEKETGMPSILEIAESKFLLQQPRGVLLTPPGLGLLTQIEKRARVDFTRMSLEELCEAMPRLILDNFSLAEEIDMTIEDDQVSLRLSEPAYKNLYSSENNLKSISILGCPIVSAVACAIAKASGKPVTIQKTDALADGSTIQVLYGIAQG